MDRHEERKLQPIYHAIDSRNYKSGIKLCSKKDIASWDLVKALKAHCLERLGRDEEALQVCREVQANNPTDANLLTTLLITYRRVGTIEEATQCYENAFKADPSNEEHGTGLFYSYARGFEFLKQQQVAMKLAKLTGKPKYTIWAALSMLLQVEDGAPDRMLEVAKRMLMKGGAEQPRNAEEMWLLLAVLKQQGLLAEAGDVVAATRLANGSTEAPKKDGEGRGLDEENVDPAPLLEEDALRLEAEAREAAGQLGQAGDVSAALLRLQPDAWDTHCGYLRCALPVAAVRDAAAAADLSVPAGAGAGSLSASLAAVRALHDQLRAGEEAAGGGGVRRGPFLAAVALQSHVMKLLLQTPPERAQAVATELHVTEGTAEAEKMRTAVCDYFSRFCSKNCCFADLQPFLAWFLPPLSPEHPLQLNASTPGEGDIGITAASLAAARASLIAWLLAQMAEAEQGSDSDAAAEESAAVAVEAWEVPERQRSALNAVKERRRQLRRFVCAAQLLRYLGEFHFVGLQGSLGETEVETGAVAVVKRLLQRHRATMTLNAQQPGETGGQRDIQPGDDLVLLAAHILRDLADRREAVGGAEAATPAHRLLQAVTVLEAALLQSPYSFQIKLLLLQLHNRLGAMERSFELFNELRIKQIQLDSLSYLLVNPHGTGLGALSMGFWAECSRNASDCCSMHRSTDRDSLDYIVRALRCGNYSKVQELVRFLRGRMRSSLHRALAGGELVNLGLMERSRSLAEVEEYLRTVTAPPPSAGARAPLGCEALALPAASVALLSDNADYELCACWDCPLRDAAAEAQQRRQRLNARLRLRQTVPLLLAAAFAGDCDGVNARYQELEAVVQGEASGQGAQGDGQGGSEGVERDVWAFTLKLFRAAASALSAVASGASDAARTDHWAAAAALFTQLNQSVDDVRRALAAMLYVGQSSAEQAPAMVGSAVSVSGLRALCNFSYQTANWATLLLLLLAKRLPRKPKKKGKKGKKPDESGAADGEAGLAQAAFRTFFESFSAAVTALAGMAKLEADQNVDGAGAQQDATTLEALGASLGFSAELCELDGLMEQREVRRQQVFRRVASSRQLSLLRVANVLSDKSAVLATVKL